MNIERVLQGGLFTSDFLADAVQEMADCGIVRGYAGGYTAIGCVFVADSRIRVVGCAG